MAVLTKVILGRKSYIVVTNEHGLVRIEASHALRGKVNIDTTGRLAKKVLAAMQQAQQQTERKPVKQRTLSSQF